MVVMKFLWVFKHVYALLLFFSASSMLLLFFRGGGGGGGSGGDRTGRDLLVFKKQSLRLNRLTILDIKKK